MTDHTLRTRRIPLDQLSAYRRNPRRGNVEAIAASLAQVGQYKPIVVNAGTLTGRELEVLAGNHTLAAARQLGWRSLACVTVDVDEEAAARIVAADNRTADLGSYDDSDLLALLSSLPDLAGTGYSESDLAELVAATSSPVSLTDPDDAPTLDETPAVAAVGDVWHLGPHRLVVGDSRDPAVFDGLLGGELADGIWTDPPYNVAVVGGTHDPRDKKNHGKGPRLSNDSMSDVAFRAFLEASFAAMLPRVVEGGAAYICHADTEGINFRCAFRDAGFFLHEVLIWAKQEFVFGRSDYHWQHEPILYGWRPGAAHRFLGDRNQSTLWQIDRPMRSAMEHPTQKPVELVAPALVNSIEPGGVMLDPFAGSGSTLIACHQTGRVARLIELDPRYADVICRRWQDHTGDMPTRDGQPVDFLEESV